MTEQGRPATKVPAVQQPSAFTKPIVRGAPMPQVFPADRDLVVKDLKTRYLRDIKMMKHKLDRGEVPLDSPLRIYALQPKHLAEARRVGLESLEGLRLV